MGKISVIIPVYNTQSYIARCLSSILSQDYTDLEVILINDGSTDGSGAVCEDYAVLDKRVRVINKSNGGISSARNAGLDIACGEYISFIDSDDWILPGMYSAVIKALSAYGDVDLCAVSITSVKDDQPVKSVFGGYTVGDRKLDYDLFYRTRTKNGNFSVCNKVFKRSFIGQNRFREGIVSEDVLFDYELYKQPGRSVYIDQIFYCYYFREGSTSNDMKSLRLDYIDIWKYIMYDNKDVSRRKIIRINLARAYFSTLLKCAYMRKGKDEFLDGKSIGLLYSEFRSYFLPLLLYRKLGFKRRAVAFILAVNYRLAGTVSRAILGDIV